ncbi:ATP synthase subunit AtpR [Marivita sp. S0852]|uniref:ATP synthase subunit AtpR n=1 Tax=Marivita sp. S0852 TaxID=3373893 RepID=UPI0039820B39
MNGIDWSAVLTGMGLGTVTSALFFAGLAFGLRIALRGTNPTPILLLSAALRIAALLLVGLWVIGQGLPMFGGFALAFLSVRVGIVMMARRGISEPGASWN